MCPGQPHLREIFLIYLRLGCLSFGGPVAHIGYFREEFVNRRKWLGEADFAELIALCQSLPGPSSSQLGFAIGWLRGGPLGALLAWLGFTLPSALLMIAAAYGLLALGQDSLDHLDGLLIAAVAIVLHAVLGMARSLCPDLPRALLALLGTAIALALPGTLGQLLVVAFGLLTGLLFFRMQDGEACTHKLPILFNQKMTLPALVLFFALLAAALILPADQAGGLVAKHYQAGALVFGGGHVVLPLLDDSIVASGLIQEKDFLAGYGVAQVLPGPLFAISALTGTLGSGTWLGGFASLLAIFLPGLLLVAALLPVWNHYRENRWTRAGLHGVNATVVGLLLAAFIHPVWTKGIQDWSDLSLASIAFVGLLKFNWPVWAVVLGCGLAGLLI